MAIAFALVGVLAARPDPSVYAAATVTNPGFETGPSQTPGSLAAG